MALTHINPTRMELAKLKKKLSTAVRGNKLLKDKRDELMRRFLDMVRVNRELRLKVESGIKDTLSYFMIAGITMSEQALSLALLIPKQEVSLDVSYKNIMSVEIPHFIYNTRTTAANDLCSYGFAYTSSELDDAIACLHNVFTDMLKLAEIEKSCQLLSSEIEKTRRRVNALEYVVIPRTKETIRYIKMKLEENERTTRIRLLKVKSMVLQNAHNY